MAKRRNLQLAEQYNLDDLEPDVDPAKAAEFLSGNRADELGIEENQPSESQLSADQPASEPQVNSQLTYQENWTSRTIRLRQSTAVALTMAACGQKSRQVKSQLEPGEPVTVQEIADRGIRLALSELGYEL
jgi:hypothetical protein